ncbi:VOC family protein [Spirosoma sp. BT702]|uniref:VOC family protein n=1 Tax=Spirosoma profusum TaxID=2771354 RepID=A0A926XTX6_9BACT|nr:VOC family protein [Spirosoma profusum]MBD2700298.1 VOC family protein [Spirosoma profusum]
MTATSLLGLRTVIYAAPDLASAKEWYTKALGTAPYFDEPFYVGFNVGGYELGLDPNAQPAEGSTLTYWGVTNIGTSLQHFLDSGATLRDSIQDVGEGIKVAAVRDPFNNVVGLIENPHFSLA